jgi:hypothetical protein
MITWIGIVLWYRVKLQRALQIVEIPTLIVGSVVFTYAGIEWDLSLWPAVVKGVRKFWG